MQIIVFLKIIFPKVSVFIFRIIYHYSIDFSTRDFLGPRVHLEERSSPFDLCSSTWIKDFPLLMCVAQWSRTWMRNPCYCSWRQRSIIREMNYVADFLDSQWRRVVLQWYPLRSRNRWYWWCWQYQRSVGIYGGFRTSQNWGAEFSKTLCYSSSRMHISTFVCFEKHLVTSLDSG